MGEIRELRMGTRSFRRLRMMAGWEKPEHTVHQIHKALLS